MKKMIKIIFTMILVVALFAISAMYLLAKAVEPNVFKNQLANVIYLKTGRHIAINGEVKLSLFPWLGVIVNDVVLDNAPYPYFSKKKFATANKVAVQIKVLPLFRQKVVISKFVFKNLTINLERDDSGINNWDDITSFMDRNAGQKQEIEMQQNGGLPMLYFSNVDVSNAVINFDDIGDPSAPKHIKVAFAHLDGEGINVNGDMFALHAQGEFKSNTPNVNSEFICNANVTLDWQKKIYSIAGLKATGNVIGELLREKTAFSVSADIDSDISKQEVTVNNLRLQLANLIATGQLRATNIIYAPEVVGDINIPTFDPKPLLHATGAIKDLQAANAVWQSAALKATVQTTSKFLKVFNLELSLNGSTISGNASYSHFNDKFVVFSLDADKLNLDNYWSPTPVTQASSQAVKADKVNSNEKPSDAIARQEAQKKVHKGVHEGTPNVTSEQESANKTSQARVKNRYKTSKKNTNTTQQPEQTDKTLYRMLRGVMLNGDLHIGDLEVVNMHFYNVKTEVTDTAGSIDISPFSCKFYHGIMSSALNIDVRRHAPIFTIDNKIVGFAAHAFLKDFIGNDKFNGVSALKMKLITTGETIDELLRNLRGTAGLHIVNGQFYGIDIGAQINKVRTFINDGQQLASSVNDINGINIPTVATNAVTTVAAAKDATTAATTPTAELSPKTSFNFLKGNFNITRGIAATKDLILQASQFKVQGQGNIDLVTRNLDLRLDASYVNGKADFYVPIQVVGPFTAPNIKPDVAVFIGRLLKNATVEKLNTQLSKGLKKGKIDAAEIVKSIKINDKNLQQLLSN